MRRPPSLKADSATLCFSSSKSGKIPGTSKGMDMILPAKRCDGYKENPALLRR